jgi:PPM family protein phosphatase
LATQLRSDLQARLGRFFEDVAQSKGATGNSLLAVGSTIGPHRSDNEDRAATAIIRFPRDHRPRIQLALVCDGMGGLIDGGQAASEAVAAFVSVIAVLDAPLQEAVSKAVDSANLAVFERLKGRGGTTLTAIVTQGREAWCAHVGDSRLYTYGPDGLALLTQDDTIQGAIQAHDGSGDEDQLDNRLLQFVGIGESITPHVFSVPIVEDHIWIITSDGAHGIGRKAFESLIEGSRGASDMARRMVFVADALNVKDNASIAAMRQSRSSDQGVALNGTTVTVSSPTQSLEIWFSESFEEQTQYRARDQDAQAQTPLQVPPLPELSLRKISTVKSKTVRRAKATATRAKRGDQPPMEVLFESKRADDRPS